MMELRAGLHDGKKRKKWTKLVRVGTRADDRVTIGQTGERGGGLGEGTAKAHGGAE